VSGTPIFDQVAAHRAERNLTHALLAAEAQLWLTRQRAALDAWRDRPLPRRLHVIKDAAA
jgi:hypothetical protein